MEAIKAEKSFNEMITVMTPEFSYGDLIAMDIFEFFGIYEAYKLKVDKQLTATEKLKNNNRR